MLIKMSTECTRQIKFQSQLPGQFRWEDGSGAWCTWARSPRCSLSHGRLPPAHRYGSDAVAVMLQPWQPKDTGEMRFLGKGGRGWSNKGCLWGKIKRSQTLFQVGEQCLSRPQLCHLSQGTSSVDEGCCHVHLPLSGLAPLFCPPQWPVLIYK